MNKLLTILLTIILSIAVTYLCPNKSYRVTSNLFLNHLLGVCSLLQILYSLSESHLLKTNC